VLGDTLERLRSSICRWFSRDPQGERVDSPRMNGFNRTQHSLSTAGHDNGQTAEKRRSRQALDRRVSALATSKIGLKRCSACTDVLIEVGPPVTTEFGKVPAQEHRNRQAKDKGAGCDLGQLLAASAEARRPDKAVYPRHSPMHGTVATAMDAGVVTGRSARPGLSMPGSDRQHRNRAYST
jgi:hypothetical protein